MPKSQTQTPPRNGVKQNPSLKVSTLVEKEVRRLNWITAVVFLLLVVLQVGLFLYVLDRVIGSTSLEIDLIVASLMLILSGIVTFFLIDQAKSRISQIVSQTVNQELGELRAISKRAKLLQEMASTLRATLSFERVVEQAMDVCAHSLEDSNISPQSVVGAVFLFQGDHLLPVVTRRFNVLDVDKTIPGQRGVVAKALQQAELTITNNPREDAELKTYTSLKNCQTVVCLPLRAGFQIFGVMVIGTDTAVPFDANQIGMFNAVADQTVIALQNAQLFQQLEAEKQRLIDADEAARKELARDLHDGPTQSIAAIAMRVNFIRSLVSRNPDQAMGELTKVEELAKQTSKDIRGMLFTLRPLVLEAQGLGPAVETVVNRIRESDGLNIRLVGAENGELLNEQAQGVVFSIVEEALGNARKYSKAKLIEVRFWREENLFVARVQDDGVGFDTQGVNQNYSSRGSLGMVNMRERAERIDGSLQVDSAPNKGATVMLVVPLDKHGRNAKPTPASKTDSPGPKKTDSQHPKKTDSQGLRPR